MTPLVVLILLALDIVCTSAITDTQLQHGPLVLNGTYDSFSQLFVRDITLAYSLTAPDITFKLVSHSEVTAPNLDSVANGTVDFTIIALSHLIHNYTTLTAKGLRPVPFMAGAVAPCYRLDALGSPALPVIFSLPVLAAIFVGNITNWSDSRIKDLNPLLAMPNQTITIITSNYARGEEEVLSSALADAVPEFAAQFAPSRQVNWPFEKYSSYNRCSGIRCVVSSITLTDGGIGVAGLANMIYCKVNFGNMKNAAGNVVAPSTSTVGFAFSELAPDALVTISSGRLYTVLVGPTGMDAYPMVELTWLVVRSSMVNVTDIECERRAAVTSFVLFLLQSSQTAQIQKDREYSPLPLVGTVSLTTLVSLFRRLTCNGVASYVYATTLQVPFSANVVETYTFSGYAYLKYLFEVLLAHRTTTETLAGNNVNFTFDAQATTGTSYEKMKSHSVDVAFILMENLNSRQKAEVTRFRATGDTFMFLPMFAMGIVSIYSRSLTSNVILPASITLDPATSIDLMIRNNVTTWSSPSIARLNPALAPLLVNVPVRSIWTCAGSGSPGTSSYELLKISGMFDDLIEETTSPTGTVPCNSSYFDRYALLAATPVGTFPAATEQGQSLLVDSTQGAYSAVWMDPYSLKSTGIGVASMLFAGRASPVIASTQSFAECFDSFSSVDFTADFSKSTSPACYSFGRAVYAMVPKSYIDVDGDGCSTAEPVLRTLMWIAQAANLSPAFEISGVARAAAKPAVTAAIVNALKSIRCIDPVTGATDTILISTPIVWSLDSGVATAAWSLAGIGLTVVLACLIALMLFGTHSVLRASNPVLLSIMCVGCALLYVADIVTGLPVTSTNCAALSWVAHIGFMLMLAPQAVRTYRVYRIFSGSQLAVVKISSRRLLSMIGVLLVLELALLTAAQVISPMQPIDEYVEEDGRTHIYTQCSFKSGAGIVLLAIQLVLKGALLLVSAVMAFSTRRVTDALNESSRIAWSIYNIIGSMLLVLVVLGVTNAKGDMKLIGNVILLFWIASVTLILSLGSRLTALTSSLISKQTDDNLDDKDHKGKHFSFLQPEALGDTATLAHYLHAMEEQKIQARSRYAMVKSGDHLNPNWMKMPTTPVHGHKHRSSVSLQGTPGHSVAQTDKKTRASIASNKVQPHPHLTEHRSSLSLHRKMSGLAPPQSSTITSSTPTTTRTLGIPQRISTITKGTPTINAAAIRGAASFSHTVTDHEISDVADIESKEALVRLPAESESKDESKMKPSSD